MKAFLAGRCLALLGLAVLFVLGVTACEPGKVSIPIGPATGGNIYIFDFGGKFIPAEQLHAAPPDRCDDYHWHASQVTTLRGETLSDPDPSGCGFGKLTDLPIRQVPRPDDYDGDQQYGLWEFSVQYLPTNP